MKRVLGVAIALFVLLYMTGCESTGRGLAQGLAEQPYRDAVKDGRMAPSEYMEKRDEMRQCSRPKNPSNDVYPMEPWE